MPIKNTSSLKSVSPHSSSRSKKFTFIDLFAGIGGFHLALHSVGGKCVFVSEWDKPARLTYELNFKPLEPEIFLKDRFAGDITKVDEKSIPNFDILAAGFPCQPFSIAGYRKGFEDQGRGNLFFDILRIIKAKKPKVVFLENVKNLHTHDKGKTFQIIHDALKEQGYSIKWAVLNSMEYGNIPQNRERIYIVGFKSKKAYEAFSFPPKVPLTETIADILEKKVDDKYYYEGKTLFPKLQNYVVKNNTVYQWRRVYVRENKRGVCPTLTANMGMGGHNVPIIKDAKGIRKLTPRECARLQGFDNLIFHENLPDSALYKQFGNAVTVPVLKRICKQIVKALNA